MKKHGLHTWLFLVAFFTASYSYAGSSIDSLKNLLLEAHDIERKIELQTLLASRYQNVDINKALEHTEKALNLSVSSNTVTYLGEIYGMFGDISVMQDSLDKAKMYYEKSLDYFSEQEDLGGVIGVMNVLGNIALVRDDLPTAMQYYLKSVGLAKKAQLENWVSGIYINIGIIYYQSGQLKKAQEYYILALEETLKSSDSLKTGDAYDNLGQTYSDLDDLQSAREYFNKALEFYNHNSPKREAAAIQNLGLTYQKEENYEKALSFYQKAAELLQEDDPNYAGPTQTLWAANYIGSGINKFHLNYVKQAQSDLEKGLQLSLVTGQLKLSRNAAAYLSGLWEKKGQADSSLKYYKLFKTYSDSLSNEDNIRKLAFQEAEFKYTQELILEKQEREKESELHQRNLIILFIAVVGLILVVVVLILLLKLSQNRTKRAELEQMNLKNELEIRNKELTTHLMFQVQNNEFILNISKKLKNLLLKATPENKPLVKKLINEIELDSSTTQWEEFEVRFQQVHTDFYKNVAQQFPDLTSNELKLCAFLKLNMSTKDIAAITYQSTNSITVARWRLRQKFGIGKEESLATFLTQY